MAKCQTCSDPAEVSWEWLGGGKLNRMNLCGFCASAHWNNKSSDKCTVPLAAGVFNWEGGPVVNISTDLFSRKELDAAKAEPIEEVTEGEKSNVVDLSLVRNGTGGGMSGDNWLLTMEPGTEFVARDKDPNNFMLARFTVVETAPKAVLLFIYNKDLSDVVPFGEVDPQRFINRFTLVERNDPPKEEETTE